LSSLPCELSAKATPASGPIRAPKMAMIVPGANAPGSKPAASKIPLMAGLVTTAAPTLSVTAMVSGLLLAAAAVTVMEAEYEPALSPAGLTATERLAGVVPLPGVTLSHAPPVAAAEKAKADVPVRLIVCAAGAVPPARAVKLRLDGLAAMVGLVVTISVTLTVWDVFEAPEELIVIVALYVLAVRPVGLTAAVRVAGVVPFAGVTVSQTPPVTLTEKESAWPAETLIVCEAGAEPPTREVKLSWVGETVIVAAPFTVNWRETVSGLLEAPAEVTVMVPE
jgi:hypothetical protein